MVSTPLACVRRVGIKQIPNNKQFRSPVHSSQLTRVHVFVTHLCRMSTPAMQGLPLSDVHTTTSSAIHIETLCMCTGSFNHQDPSQEEEVPQPPSLVQGISGQRGGGLRSPTWGGDTNKTHRKKYLMPPSFMNILFELSLKNLGFGSKFCSGWLQKQPSNPHLNMVFDHLPKKKNGTSSCVFPCSLRTRVCGRPRPHARENSSK